MLRATNRQQIAERLEESYFGIENYSLQFYQEDEDLLLDITFLGNGNYSFQLSRYGAEGFSSKEAPGERFLAPESFLCQSQTIALNRITRWTERIREELVSSNPFAREIADLREQLDIRLAQLGDDLNSYFSKDEGALLDERLKLFSDRLDTLSKENQDLKDSVDKLKTVVSELRDSTGTLNKGTWLRMSAGRLLSGLKSMAASKEAKELALEVAKKFLLEGPK